MWQYNSTYLAHHGRPNQKWGVQNGPPYPLKNEGRYNAGVESEAEKKEKEDKKTNNSSGSQTISEKQNQQGNQSSSNSGQSNNQNRDNQNNNQNRNNDNLRNDKSSNKEEPKSELAKKNEDLKEKIENEKLKKELKELKRGPIRKFIRNTIKGSIAEPIQSGVKQAVGDTVKEAGTKFLRDSLGLRNKDLENAKQMKELLSTNKEVAATLYTLREGREQYKKNLQAELERQHAAKEAEAAYNHRVAKENKRVSWDRWDQYSKSIDAKVSDGTYKPPTPAYQVREMTEKQKQQQNQNGKKKNRK